VDESGNPPRKRRRMPIAWLALTTAVEWYVLAEILWFTLHNGESTIYGTVGEYLSSMHERRKQDADVKRTLDMIRDLPET
jgi:hypothetical protein